MSLELKKLLELSGNVLAAANPMERLEFFHLLEQPYCGQCGHHRAACTCDEKATP